MSHTFSHQKLDSWFNWLWSYSSKQVKVDEMFFFIMLWTNLQHQLFWALFWETGLHSNQTRTKFQGFFQCFHAQYELNVPRKVWLLTLKLIYISGFLIFNLSSCPSHRLCKGTLKWPGNCNLSQK